MQSAVRHLAFDAKGRNLAVGGDDGVIRMINISVSQWATQSDGDP